MSAEPMMGEQSANEQNLRGCVMSSASPLAGQGGSVALVKHDDGLDKPISPGFLLLPTFSP